MRWGSRFVERLNGMFAFALWDNRERELLLARDPLGIKPLYYTEPRPGSILFASEIKALCAHPAVWREPDFQTIQQHLTFCHSCTDRTALRGIRRLEPGTMLHWQAGKANIADHGAIGSPVSAANMRRRDVLPLIVSGPPSKPLRAATRLRRPARLVLKRRSRQQPDHGHRRPRLAVTPTPSQLHDQHSARVQPHRPGASRCSLCAQAGGPAWVLIAGNRNCASGRLAFAVAHSSLG